MEKEQVVAAVKEALGRITPPFPEVGWVHLTTILRDNEGLARNFTGRSPDWELSHLLERSTEFELGLLGRNRTIRLRREKPYPKETDENDFRYLAAVVKLYNVYGEASAELVAKEVGCAPTTANQTLGGITKYRGYLERVRSGVFRPATDLGESVWVWGMKQRIGHLADLRVVHQAKKEIVDQHIVISASHLIKARQVLDSAIGEVETILDSLKASRARLDDV